MQADRFQRASEVFLEARRCEPARRDALLADRCGPDLQLLEEVRRLLAGDAEAPEADGLSAGSGAIGAALRAAAAHALESGTRAADGVAHASHDGNAGRRIGRYRLLHRIGEGGMGAVYLAEQDNPKRRVAIKIIRPGVLSPSLSRRFEHEAQVLGRLQHPGIAQIFEAGTNDVGEGAQPYFAMEYVDGAPLNVIAKKDDLSTRDRLELLARIADAVEHAHQRGVIHRDLKPGNILVVEHAEASDEAKPSRLNPKILDFGVARAIDSDVQATTLHTVAGQIIGTVAYMSPEQAAGNPDDIDTRSDVYALGVIGYELLAGRPPHDLSKRTVPDALRTILESDASTLGQVDRNLRGDVETIIARAMEKDRARRYQSAAEFAGDIRRYLRDEPIVARPPSTIYQFRKFARRNKALVGGIAAAFLLLVAGIVGTSIGMRRAMGEARKAQRMNEYLQGMIAFLDPSVTKNNQVTLRNVLDDASRRVETELGGEPDVAAEILITIARGYSNIGQYHLAAAHGTRALALLRQAGADDDLIYAAVWELVGLNHFRDDHPVEAEQAYREALAINLRYLGDAHPDSLGNIRDIIHLLRIQRKEADTEELVEIASRSVASLTGRDENTGLALEAVADILGNQHRLPEAEQLYLRAIEVLEGVQGSAYATEQRIVCMRNLAFILEMQQRTAEATEFDQRAVDLSLATYGPEHEVTLISMQGLLRMLRAGGQLERAEEIARQSVAITSKLYGESSTEAGHDVHNLAMVVRERGRVTESIELFERSLALRRQHLAADDLDLARTLAGLGMALVDDGRGGEAVAPMREAIAIRIKQLGEEHPSVPFMRTVLGAALVVAGQYEEAESLLVNAIPRLNTQPGQKAEAIAWLVELYDAWNKPELAAKYRAMQPAPTTDAAVAATAPATDS